MVMLALLGVRLQLILLIFSVPIFLRTNSETFIKFDMKRIITSTRHTRSSVGQEHVAFKDGTSEHVSQYQRAATGWQYSNNLTKIEYKNGWVKAHLPFSSTSEKAVQCGGSRTSDTCATYNRSGNFATEGCGKS
jgi:hypothetical protein